MKRLILLILILGLIFPIYQLIHASGNGVSFTGITSIAGSPEPEGEWYGTDEEPVVGNGTSFNNYTYIWPVAYDGDNGYIKKIEIYIGTGSGTLDFAVFNNTGGTTFQDDHVVLGLSVSSGLNQFEHDVDFDAADLPIDSGEYTGCVTASVLHTKITSGGSGYKYDSGDQISGTPTGTSFSTSGNTTHDFQWRVYIESAVP